jgi:hypothetical protein
MTGSIIGRRKNPLEGTTGSVFLGTAPHPIGGLVGSVSWWFPPVVILVGMTGPFATMVVMVILQ